MPILSVIVVMLVSGLLGGVIACYLETTSADVPDSKPKLVLYQYILVGIGASFIVPLFLNTISSTLIQDILEAETPNSTFSKLLILTGFCLVASIASRRFITSISDRILREVKEAKQEARAATVIAAEVAADEREPESGSTIKMLDADTRITMSRLTNQEQIVLATLNSGEYKRRAFSGILRDSGINNPDQVGATLEILIQKGLVSKDETQAGFPRYRLTTIGRTVANSEEFKQLNATRNA